MQIVEHLREGLKRSYHITFPAEKVSLTYTEKYGALSRTAKVPGFRSGKIPVHVLKSRYHDRVKRDVLQDLLEQGTQKALEQAQGRTAATPRVEIEKEGDNQDLAFLVHMELLPDIQLKPYDALILERMVYEVASEDVERELNAMAQRFRDWQPAGKTHKAQKGDQISFKLQGTLDDKPLDFEGQQIHVLELGQGHLKGPEGHIIPGLAEALEGHKEGEAWDVPVSFPQDYPFPEWAGKKATFHVSVVAIKLPCPIDLSDAFAQKRGFDTLIELREALRHHLQKSFDERTFLHVKRQLLDALAGQYGDVPVPEDLTRQEFNNIWAEFNRYLQQGSEEGIATEASQKEYYQIAERRIRLGLVLSEIGHHNAITVTVEELSQAVAEAARQYPGQESEVVKFYKKNPQALQALQAPLFENKVVRFILSQNKIGVRKVSLAELEQAEEHLEAHAPVTKTPKKSPSKTSSSSAAQESSQESAGASPKRKKAKASS